MKCLLKKVIFMSMASICFFPPVAQAASAYTQDTGTITTLYVTSGGTIAIKLSGGFPNAGADGQCPAAAAAQNFGGNSTISDPLMKSALLSAKAAQQTIKVTVQGCDSNNPLWYKITDVYVN